MRYLLKKYFTTTVSVFLVSRLQLGLEVENSFLNFLVSGLILYILLFLKSFIDTLLFPLNLITLNSTKWITFLIIIYLWSKILPSAEFKPFNFSGITIGPLIVNRTFIPYWLSVLVMSLTLVLMIKFFSWLTG